MHGKSLVVVLLFLAAGGAHAAEPAREKPVLLVFAAASLTNVLEELAPIHETSTGVTLRHSFAASSVLARQVEAGGRADVFLSADQEWMDYLQSRDLLDSSTRRDLAGNRLVLIAPIDSPIELRIAPGFPLLTALGTDGRLATGDPDTVPAGRYARAALMSLGVWDGVAPRLARADNVRGAMMFVSRREAPLGIVYATDALADSKVRVVGTFPADTHPAITYPAAAVRGGSRHAAAYLAFLSSRDATAIWKRHGFKDPAR
jgi:molybdate transport system substrate-binding protein